MKIDECDVDVGIGNEPEISLERLRQMISELEVIAKKGIQKRKNRGLKDKTVMGRKIYVGDNGNSFDYFVEFYAKNSQGNRMVLIGESEYTSESLRKRHKRITETS